MSEESPQPQLFDIRRPEVNRSKVITRLCKTDMVRGDMQFLKGGGENELHAHLANDGFWLCMEGQFRFYGEGDEIIATLNPKEGILIPSGFSYWFESVGDDVAEILHVASLDPNLPDQRIGGAPTPDAILIDSHAG
ncbi:MAG TPA: hypothetical protein VNE42_09595 [Acidimicrobiales bacterium]|nr:hypothetical protein [Acidimicrobiales bacterium]